MQQKKHIDIFLSVIDNMGDMGFACELIAAIERAYPTSYEFDIWTDCVAKVESFLNTNGPSLGKYQIHTRADFGRYMSSELAISLFHAPIPDDRFFRKWSLVLRIDYLSFDKSWTQHTWVEHITSTHDRRIIEVIPSPLSTGSGLIPTYPSTYSRQTLAQRYSLDMTKKWIPIFIYPETLKEGIWLDSIPDGYSVILFWQPAPIEKIWYQDIPWTDVGTWHSFIDASHWCIVRGEVSAVAALSRNKIAYWDMYKEIGGFHHKQSDDFLDFIHADHRYRELHLRLNRQINTRISLSELIQYQENSQNIWYKKVFCAHNLIEEIKKCIDSHEFSI